MTRSARPWWLALAISLLLHVSLLGGLNWSLPQWQATPESPPIEARLMPVAPGVPPTPPAPKPVPPRRKPSRPPPPKPEPPAEAVAETGMPDVIAMAADTEPNATPSVVAPADNAAEIEPTPEPATPPLNALPDRLDLRYQVSYGLAAGEQTLLWVNEGKHYTITSVAAATGLTSVFYSGRFVQTSRGRITAQGLQPEEFWDQRGNKRSSARFDAANNMLTLTPAQGAPRHFSYQNGVQDALSLFFQLVLTAPPPEGKLSFEVFNGKKLRNYTYEVRGEEVLETALGTLNTLHLARVTDGDGHFEVWLAIDRYYLPVRVLRSDDKGYEMELRLKSIAP